MIKLVITDLDGTFLNSQGSFDRPYYEQVSQQMKEAGVAFAACTGKQCERVEELFGEAAADVWILGDSATRIKHQGEYIFESLLPNELGRRIIAKLAAIAQDHVIIACTPTAAYIAETTNEADAQKVRGSYRVGKTVTDYQTITEDFVKLTIFDPKLRCFEHGLNDLELMAAGTFSFAMSNAFEEVKAAAAFVTKSNDENGVLKTIERLLPLQMNQ